MTSGLYFNEFDPFAAQWLRELFPSATVDERSIVDVSPCDLAGYERCHFFGGIGGWEYALRLAGWQGPVWTGSCPCQPLSCAGKRGGEKDERHLWPEFYRLISECRPPVVFGEQVASKDGLEWLDGICLDLEELGYAVGASDLSAASVGAPHIRQRVFWVAYAECGSAERRGHDLGTTPSRVQGTDGQWERLRHDTGAGESVDGLAKSHGAELQRIASSWQQPEHEQDDGDGGLGNPNGGQLAQHPEQSARQELQAFAGTGGADSGMGKPDSAGSQPGREPTKTYGYGRTHEPAGCWSDFLLIPCRDNKVRRISAESSDVPLAHGIPRDVGRMFPALAGLAKGARRNRVGRLKGYGNAVVPEVAASFIQAFMECLQ